MTDQFGVQSRPKGRHSFTDSDLDGLDDLVRRFMREFEIPGLAVAIVRAGQPAFSRGYGVRTLGRPEPVSINTQFAIASNSKAFLAASLAMLVDEAKLDWDDPVVRHLPEFQMHDPSVTAMMTVRDLLTHRSGLPLGAGDLMQFPRTDHTAEEVLRALAHLKPARSFRAGYAYDNCLYIVAGVLLERVSGLGWDQFVARRIFDALGMHDAVTNPTLVRTVDRAGRHGRRGPVIGVGTVEALVPDETAIIGPAGGINASVAEIVPWLQVQLGRGLTPDGQRLWSDIQAEEMWRPQTITSSGPGPTPDEPFQSVLEAYALGWRVSDHYGRRTVWHGGGLDGQITRTTLLPDEGLGFVLFSNSEEQHAINGLQRAVLDHLLGAPAFDWVAATRKAIATAQSKVAAIVQDGDFTPPDGGPSLELDRYAGRYRDPWYGDILVARRDDGLAIDFTRTPAFKSALEPFGPDAFRTRFSRGEDAVVTFAVEAGAVTGVTMKALSPLADFSYDFHDLAFVPVRP